jgi:asparagine synthase (glutamine-hydrolysing)
MSGICGFVLQHRDARGNTPYLLPMMRALDIEGQSEGVTSSLGQVAMGAQRFPGRLAGIAKTSLGEHVLTLAFHGSLYNVGELSHHAGRVANLFEGLLQYYLVEGMTFVNRLRGEFALALWDGSAETLHLAADRFRVHPLFYYRDGDRFVFSSRMKGLLACPLLRKWTIHPEAVVDVVASSIIPTPKTLFREVQKLPPGHVLTYHSGEITLSRYWEIGFLQSDHAGRMEVTRKLKTHFTEALSIRLEEDKASDRIGTFLSGGVDSSTVTGVLTQLAKRPIKSFSIGFAEGQFNEINYARIAARAFDAEHYEYIVTPQDACEAIPIVLEAFDEPFANASAIPTYFCAKMAREHGVDVLYAGDGGDELFAGNERYATQRLFEYYDKIPAWLREPVVKPLILALAETVQWTPFVKGKKYIRRASIPYPERLSTYAFFREVPMTDLLDDGLLEAVGQDYDPYAPINSYYHQAPAQSELDRQLYIDLKLAISDNDLFKVTRMTELAGVTVRFPFLDHRFAEFAASIPARLKMPGRQLRAFFKNAYADLLPWEIRAKTKHGFGLPIPIWLKTDPRLNAMMYDLVLSPRGIPRGYFRKKGLEALIESHKTDSTSFYGTILWNLMILELWFRTCVYPFTHADVSIAN